jgi:DNA-binding SARP family transcriptional activator/basic membrane lipoprotein Med (substrate-binding protein (PBP1-ABC) superfamily)
MALASGSNGLSSSVERCFAAPVTSDVVEFRVLGPLEVVSGEAQLALGGAKQRAVLAVLLLRAGEVVPLERLIDEVWGNDPPPSAAHTLESYVSRLRQLLGGRGPILSRRGPGYSVELRGAQLDALAFAALHDSAALASALDESAKALELANAALALWRGPVLADVALASAGRAEAERFEELRLRTYELRFDAELALGHHEPAIGELQALVAQSPYRERFVAQLMLALYRSGRHAEALDVYERTRRRLHDDLGLQPSVELQQLSGQIVRQDPVLERTARASALPPLSLGPRRRRPAALLAAAAAMVGSILALAASGGAAVRDQAPTNARRLALVVPAPPTRDVATQGLRKATVNADYLYGVVPWVASVDPREPRRAARRVAARIRTEGVGLVLTLGEGSVAQALAKFVRSMPATRFVFVDASLRDLELEGVPNAAAIRFAEEDVLFLAGYLSGLVPTMSDPGSRVDKVSVVAAEADRVTGRLIAGFRQGLRETRPEITLRVDYAHEADDPTACERLANRQIDDGSDVVLAVAGRCGLGAVTVAKIRGVWSVGAEEDGVMPNTRVLMSTYKNWGDASLFAIERLVRNALPMGRDTVLGLEDDYTAGLWFSDEIQGEIASAVVRRCSVLRSSRHRDL